MRAGSLVGVVGPWVRAGMRWRSSSYKKTKGGWGFFPGGDWMGGGQNRRIGGLFGGVNARWWDKDGCV